MFFQTILSIYFLIKRSNKGDLILDDIEFIKILSIITIIIVIINLIYTFILFLLHIFTIEADKDFGGYSIDTISTNFQDMSGLNIAIDIIIMILERSFLYCLCNFNL